MEQIGLDYLPRELAQRVKATVGNVTDLVIKRVEGLVDKSGESYHVYAVAGGWLTHMTLSVRKGQIEEYSRVTALETLRGAEIRNDSATISVDSDEGIYSTGVPTEIARQIIRTGKSRAGTGPPPAERND